MKPEPKVSTLAEVYLRIIERTVDALKKYLNSAQKKYLRYDVVKELKDRWKLRVDLLIDSMNGSWAKFQELCVQKNVKYDSTETKKPPFCNFCFPSICSLSWDLYKYSKARDDKASNFKLWVWNCMVSGIINQGNLPVPSFLWQKMKLSSLKSVNRSISLNYSRGAKNNKFNWIGLMRKKNHISNTKDTGVSFLNYYSISKNLTENSLENQEKDSSNDSSDEDLERKNQENYEKESAPNFLLAVIEKVYRRNTKWTIVLKNGILNINKKDFLFNFCKCEFFW